MAYEGEALLACPANALTGPHAFAVIVSGSGPNVCGHAILNSGDYYFHVSGEWYAYPKYMNARQFERYKQENHKRELRRDFVFLPNPVGAHRKLEELLSQKWFWGVLPHNCVNFVEQILHAGGATSAGEYFNCPRAESF